MVKIKKESVYYSLPYIALAVLAVGSLVTVLHFGLVYRAIDDCNQQRLTIIEQSVEEKAKQIHLPSFPYGQYLWNPDPENDDRVGYYKEFYHIPEEIQVFFG